MKKKTTALAVLGVLGLLLAGPSAASAFGGPMVGGFSNATPEQIAERHSEMFARQAALIGATVEEVKNAWASGTSFKDLALSKGITEEQLKAKQQAEHEAKAKLRMQSLVDKGVITQAQADQRLAAMKNFKGKEGGRKGPQGR